ncbi:MAG: hypothetical protein PHC64_04105 [Candidatus Gastranaerophilales bacterium]|nr:hypothetical protein [Candidatus Gastranaerophilales bacterium]
MKAVSISFGNQQKQTENKPESSTLRKVLGISLGTVAGAILPYNTFKTAISTCDVTTKGIILQFHHFTMPDIDSFSHNKEAAENALERTGLKGKGVKLFIANKNNVAEIKNIIAGDFPHCYPFRNRIIESFAQQCSNGINACYTEKEKNIIINSKELFSAVFHEIGHAMNANNSIFMKLIQKAKRITPFGVPIVGLGFLAMGLLHKTKPEEKDKSKFEKSKDFIKNNAGKLTFLTFLPMLIEEGAASIKGLKLAKKCFKPEQVTRLSKNYLFAYSTYFTVAVLSSLLISLGIKIKDKIAPN